ncbi:MAG: adenine nucleotide alpha hydrolase [Actinobacteria bacterium]|nr:MAG: adenine nucleotide alpha hydrolase [Actinomycetota bacterium]TML66143.1 MAG: adenine nucleotide alpha hydrolase [Actinomycetota bacterium]
MSWSSGKDSAFALHRMRAIGDLEICALLVTVNADADRVAMHAVRRQLLEAQASRLGLPLRVVEIPSPCPNDIYEMRMADALVTARAEGIDHMIFGDLFLEDVRAYRERNLADTGITPVFPLWGEPTDRLAHHMVDAGVRAVLTCVDPAVLPATFAGRDYDEALLADLPAGIDPCGERGEFHTFVWDGPGFDAPLTIRRGETVTRDGFVFCDILADDESSTAN